MDNLPAKRVFQDIKMLLLFILFFFICVGIVLAMGVFFGGMASVSQDSTMLIGFHDHRL